MNFSPGPWTYLAACIAMRLGIPCTSGRRRYDVPEPSLRAREHAVWWALLLLVVVLAVVVAIWRLW